MRVVSIGFSTMMLLGAPTVFAAQECFDLSVVSGATAATPKSEICFEEASGKADIKIKHKNKIYVHFKGLKVFRAVCAMGPCTAPTTYSPNLGQGFGVSAFTLTKTPKADLKSGEITIGAGGTNGSMKFQYQKKGSGGTSSCKVGGCSGQLCYDPATGSGVSTCEWRAEYACYRTAECKSQSDGKCGWTQTQALKDCLKSPPQ